MSGEGKTRLDALLSCPLAPRAGTVNLTCAVLHDFLSSHPDLSFTLCKAFVSNKLWFPKGMHFGSVVLLHPLQSSPGLVSPKAVVIMFAGQILHQISQQLLVFLDLALLTLGEREE